MRRILLAARSFFSSERLYLWAWRIAVLMLLFKILESTEDIGSSLPYSWTDTHLQQAVDEIKEDVRLIRRYSR